MTSTTLIYEGAGSNVVFDTTALGMPENTGDEYFADCEVVGHGPLHQPARRPVPARGARLGGGVDRRSPAPVDHHPARAGRQGRRTSPSTGSTPPTCASSRPMSAAGSAPRSASYPEELLLGPIAKQIGRPVTWRETRSESMMALGHGRAQLQYVTHRRQPRRQGHALPLHAIQDCGGFVEIGTDPRAVHDPPDVVGRVRHPEHRVPHHVASSPTRRRSSPTAAPAGPRPPPRSSGRWTCSPPRSAWTPPRCAGSTSSRSSSSRTPPSIGQTYDVGDYEAALDKALDAAGYTELRAEQAKRRASRATTSNSASASACTSRSPAASPPMGEQRQDRGARRRPAPSSTPARRPTVRATSRPGR